MHCDARFEHDQHRRVPLRQASTAGFLFSYFISLHTVRAETFHVAGHQAKYLQACRTERCHGNVRWSMFRMVTNMWRPSKELSFHVPCVQIGELTACVVCNATFLLLALVPLLCAEYQYMHTVAHHRQRFGDVVVTCDPIWVRRYTVSM